MCKTYHCLPTDLWVFDATTPKGFYFNQGVFFFCRMIENEMNQVEAMSRRNRSGASADRLANTARLQVLSKYLQTDSIKAYRDPGNVQTSNANSPFVDPDKENSKSPDKDESTIIMKGF